MIPYKINDETVQVPSNWDDLSFNQWEQINKLTVNDFIKLASIVLNIDYEQLSKAKIENAEELVDYLQFIYAPIETESRPLKLGEYDIPEDITFESLAQFEDMRKTLNEALTKIDSEKDIFKIVPVIAEYYPQWCAIYLQKVRDGSYDYKKALDMIPTIKELPCTDVIAVGTFFFYRQANLLVNTLKTFRKPSPQ